MTRYAEATRRAGARRCDPGCAWCGGAGSVLMPGRWGVETCPARDAEVAEWCRDFGVKPGQVRPVATTRPL